MKQESGSISLSLERFRDPNSCRIGLALDGYTRRLSNPLWNIRNPPIVLALCQEWASLDCVLSAFTMTWRLRNGAVDRTHGTDRECQVSS